MDVIVFQTLGAPRRHLLKGRRPGRAPAGDADPEPVPISRVTVIDAGGFADLPEAERWLASCRTHEGEHRVATEAALHAVNRAMQGQRVSAADPHLHDVAHAHVLTVRLGYGAGSEVIEGRWQEAYTLPARKRSSARRTAALVSQQQLAATLSGRSPVHPSEDLLLRARLDLGEGRLRQAALQAGIALDALVHELERDAAHREMLAALRSHREPAAESAGAALRGDLDEAQATALADLIERMERIMRRRRHRGTS